MNKLNTSLGQLLALVSKSRFEKLIQEHKSAYKSKGLRSIEAGMNSQRNRFNHLGIAGNREVKQSTLSYANSNRNAKLYKSLFETTLEKAQENSASHGLRFKNSLYSVDTTSIDLCLNLFPWADFREKKGWIKVTVKLNHQGKIRCFVAESNAREDDSRKIRLIPFAANEVVVFECGYADYDYFAFLTGQEVWIVTRLKKNAQFKWVKKDESTGKNIESDYEIIISGYSREKRLRKIIVLDPDTGEKIRLLTNNLKWAESRVSAMYKDWWQIELFFKEIKRFYGNSKNEVMTQIWIMFIVYLLFYLLKAQSKNMGMWFSNVISDIKTMLFQRMCLFEWLLNRLPSPKLPKTPLVQQEFVW